MKRNIIIVLMAIFIIGNLSARDRDYDNSNISITSSYILPIENSALNSSLVLGLGADFWGVFEFVGNMYFEIDHKEEDFFDKFQTPNVFSAGVGMNIPMGGFYLKGDYQRFFAFETNDDELSVSNYTDSYKLGIGIEIDHDIEVEVYHRTLIDGSDDIFTGDKQGFMGVGLNFSL